MTVCLVALGAACSTDASSDSADSVVADPDAGPIQVGGEPVVETGTMTVTVVAADGTSPITVADRLDQLLAAYSGTKRASVDGSVVTAVTTEFPRDEALTFDFTMRPEPVVSLHPVLFCPDTGEDGAEGSDGAEGTDGAPPDPLPDDAVVVSGEKVGECVLGPSPFERSPFIDAFVLQTLDIQVTVDIDPELIDEFNALTQACYDTTELCPSQQIALVSDGEILTAPMVNIAEFPSTLALTDDFTVESAEELADTIVLDRYTGEFVSAQYDFEADA
jgi:hypothetical protein